MANPFDQFDSSAATAEANPFDVFDAPQGNPFDQFDGQTKAKENTFDAFKAPAPAVPAPDTFRPGAGPAGEPAAAPPVVAGAVQGIDGVAQLAQAAGAPAVAADATGGAVEAGRAILGLGGVAVAPAAPVPQSRPFVVPSGGPMMPAPVGVPAQPDSVGSDLAAAASNAVYNAGAGFMQSLNSSPAMPAGPTPPPVTDQQRRVQAAEMRRQADIDAREVLPVTPDRAKPVEALIQGAVEAAPGLALMAPIAGPSQVASAVNAAGRAVGVGSRVAGAAAGAAGTATALTEFNVASQVPESLRTGDTSTLTDAAVRLPESLARLAPGGDSPEFEDYVNAVLIMLGGAWGGVKAPKGGLPAQRAPGQEAARGGTTLSPEAQRFVDNIPAQNLASWEAKMGRRAAEGNAGAAAMRDAIRNRMNGTTPQAPAPEPVTPSPAAQTAPNSTTPAAIVPREASTTGGVPGSSKPFQAVAPTPSVPPQPAPAPAPVQTPPAAQAPQTGVKPPIQENVPRETSPQAAPAQAAAPEADEAPAPRDLLAVPAPESLPAGGGAPAPGVGAKAPAAGGKEPWEMTADEFSKSITERPTSARPISFDQWRTQKGIPASEVVSDAEFATFVGQTAFPQQRSRAEKGKQGALAKRVRRTQELQKQYQAEVPEEAGAPRPLVRGRGDDEAYIRASRKRAVSKAIAAGKPVPAEVLADYPDLKPAAKPVEPSPAKQAESSKEPPSTSEGAFTIDDSGVFSARAAHLEKIRERVGLNAPPSPSRSSWAKALSTAKADGLASKAKAKAEAVLAKPYAMNDVDTAGLVLRGMEIVDQHEAMIQKAIKSPSEVSPTWAIEKAALQDELDVITLALRKSGTEKGRALASQKLTIDRSFKLAPMRAEARANNGGKELPPEVDKRIEDLAGQIKTLGDTVKNLETTLAAERAATGLERARGRKLSPERVKANRDKLRTLLKADCHRG